MARRRCADECAGAWPPTPSEALEARLHLAFGLGASFDVPTGSDPIALAVADFDLNGTMDVAVAHAGNDGVWILPRQTDGTFASPVKLPVVGQASALVADDIDGTSGPDLVVADGTHDLIRVFRNTGSGSFTAPLDLLAGDQPQSVALADLDDLNGPDLLIGNTGSGTVSVLLNQGNGAFVAAAGQVNVTGVRAIGAGDVNGDGLVDVLATYGGASGSLALRPGNGDGTFSTGSNHSTFGRSLSHLQLLDRDGDGDLDVAGISQDYGYLITLTNAGGAYGSAAQTFVGLPPAGVAAGDLDNDGSPDLAFGHAAAPFGNTFFRNDGQGRFARDSTIPSDAAVTAVLLADADGDGDADLLRTTADGILTVQALVTPGRVEGVVRRDLDGDGLLAGDEPGLPGVQVSATLASGGGAVATATTDSAGRYRLKGLPAGEYRVTVAPPAGFQQTAPASSAAAAAAAAAAAGHAVTIAQATLIDDLDFGLESLLGTVVGTVWRDEDGDGVRGPAEGPAADWAVFVDANQNGLLDGLATLRSAGAPLATSSAFSGITSSIDVAGLAGRIADVDVAVRVQHAHAGYDLDVRLTGPGNQRVNLYDNNYVRDWVDFPGTTFDDEAPASIDAPSPTRAGRFRPAQALRAFDGAVPTGQWTLTVIDSGYGDLGTLEGWSITIRTDQAETFTFTDAQGAYALRDVPLGQVDLVARARPDWQQTYPAHGAPQRLEITERAMLSGIDFGQRPEPGTIRGRAWADLDGDGEIDGATEPPLPNWTVFLETIDINGQLDPGEPTALTDADGNYEFGGLMPGAYTVGQLLPERSTPERPAWLPTHPPEGGYDVELSAGQVLEPLTFAAIQLAHLGGRVLEVIGRDGPDDDPRDVSLEGMSPWNVFLDLDGDGLLDPGEPSATTSTDDPATTTLDEGGFFFFENLDPGVFLLAQRLRAGYEQLEPEDPKAFTVRLGPGDVAGGFEFLNERAEIAGTLFDDHDRDGVRDPGEPGLDGWTVELDKFDDGSADFVDVTDASGQYSFKFVGTGRFRVRAAGPTAWVQAAPPAGSHLVELSAGTGEPPDSDFGFFRKPDLLVGRMPTSPVEPGEQLQVNYTTALEGEGRLGPDDAWLEELYLLDGNGLEILLASQTVTAVGARSVPVTMPSLGLAPSEAGGGGGVITAEQMGAGLYFEVRVDPANAVLEVGKENNVGRQLVSWKLPDLRVSKGVGINVATFVTQPNFGFDPARRLLAFDGRIEYPVWNQGPGTVPAGAGWWESVWLGTDADVDRPDDVANGVWHVPLAQILATANDPLLPFTRIDRSFAIDIPTPIKVPKEIGYDDLKLIVFLDRQPADVTPQSPYGNLLERHEVAPVQAPPFNNVWVQPLHFTWRESVSTEGVEQNLGLPLLAAEGPTETEMGTGTAVGPVALAAIAPPTEPPRPIDLYLGGDPSGAAMSDDGRFVAFSSMATNLVAGDTNGRSDVFLRDRDTDEDGIFDEADAVHTRRISINRFGAQADGSSGAPRISGNGRYVVFTSTATNLDPDRPDTTPDLSDVFWHDVATGVTKRVSVRSGGAGGDEWSLNPDVTDDGQYVVFQSSALDLLPGTRVGWDGRADERNPWAGDENYGSDIFLHHVATATTTLLSVGPDGRQATRLVRDEDDGLVERADTAFFTNPRISGDGRYVVFEGTRWLVSGPDLIDGQLPVASPRGRPVWGTEIFLLDRATRQVLPVTDGNAPSFNPSVSADGGRIVFTSMASDLADQDANGQGTSTFVWTRDGGKTELVSLDPQDQPLGDGYMLQGRPEISDDGRMIAFLGTPPGSNQFYTNVWARDLDVQRTTLVSALAPYVVFGQTRGQGVYPGISGNGLWVSFAGFDTSVFDADFDERFDNFVRYVEVPELATGYGTLYLDRDKDGQRDADEALLPGRVVEVDTNLDGTPDRTSTTEQNGVYEIRNIPEGSTWQARPRWDVEHENTSPAAGENGGWRRFRAGGPGAVYGNLDLGVFRKPDLRVKELTVQPTELGSQATYGWTVENANGGIILPEQTWVEELWLVGDGDDAIDGNGYEKLLASLTRGTVEGKRSALVTLPDVDKEFAVTDPTNYVSPQQLKEGLKLLVRIDPQNPGAPPDDASGAVVEVDETNNGLAQPGRWKLPDLHVTIPNRGQFAFGSEVDLTVRVENRGDAKIPDESNWQLHMYLASYEEVWRDPVAADGEWKLRVALPVLDAIWIPNNGLAAPGSRRDVDLKVDLRGIPAPSGIDVTSLRWVFAMDYGYRTDAISTPVPPTDPEADPGDVAETHEVHPPDTSPPLIPHNVFSYPVSAIDLGLFKIVTTADFTWEEDKFVGEGLFQLGFHNTEPEPFHPIVTIDGTVSYNEFKISVSGTTRLALLPSVGSNNFLLAGDWELDLKEQAGAVARDLINAFHEEALEFAGMKIKLESFAFGGTFQHPQFIVQGEVKFPETMGNISFEVTGDHALTVSGAGIDLTGGKLSLPDDLTIQFFGYDFLKAQDLSVEYARAEKSVKIQGKVNLPLFYDLEADFTEDNYIEIKDGSVTVKGTLKVEDAVLVPRTFEVKEAQVVIDTEKKEFRGEATVRIPGSVDVIGGLGFLNGELNFVEFGVDGLNKPIVGAPAVFLQRLVGRLNNIAKSSKESLLVAGEIGLSVGPVVHVPLPSYLGGDLRAVLIELLLMGEVSADMLRASGRLDLVDGLAQGTGSVKLDWSKLTLESEVGLTAFAGAVQTSASLKAALFPLLSIQGGGQATLTIPEEVPVIGGMSPADNRFMLSYVMDANADNDFVAAWGSATVGAGPLSTVIAVGLRVYFDGRWGFIGTEEVAALQIEPGAAPPSLLSATDGPSVSASAALAQQSGFEVLGERQWLILSVAWDGTATSAAVQVTRPDGTLLDEAAIAGSAQVGFVGEMSGAGRRAVLVRNPEAGIWSVGVVDAPDLGQVTLRALLANAAPTLQLTAPAQDTIVSAGVAVQVPYVATDPDSAARVTLYYDDDREGYDGVQIADGLPEDDGPGTHWWGTTAADVPPGDYYVYGVIMDDQGVPVFSDYSVGRVTVVDPLAPEAPRDLQVLWSGGGDAVEVSWQPVADAAFYIVSYTGDAAAEGYLDQLTTRGSESALRIEGLMRDRAYRFTVQAVSNAGASSARATAAIGVAGATMPTAAPAGQWAVLARPGTVYAGAVPVSAGDQLTLLGAPTGGAATLSPDGAFTWDAADAPDGWHEVRILVTHGDGSTRLVRRHLLKDGAWSGAIGGRAVHDVDGDGAAEVGEAGLSDRTVQLLDRHGQILVTAMTTSQDLNGNGTFEFDETGHFAFADLVPGHYALRIVHPAAGWTSTGPSPQANVIVRRGEVLPVQLTSRRETGRLGGVAFDDADGNGRRDPTEVGRAGVGIFLDLNGNGARDAAAFSFSSPTQAFPQPIPDLGSLQAHLHVEGVPGQVVGATVSVRIAHDYSGDLDLALVAPDGTVIPLLSDVGAAPGLIEVLLSDDAATAAADLPNAAEPPSGSLRPQVPLALLSGVAPGGTWTLRITDDARSDLGSLLSWTLGLHVLEPLRETSPDDPATPTVDEAGTWGFSDLPSGSYRVTAVVPAGLSQTFPDAGGGAGHVLPLMPGGVIEHLDFGLRSAPGLSTVQGSPGDDVIRIAMDPTGEYLEAFVNPATPGAAPQLRLHRSDVRHLVIAGFGGHDVLGGALAAGLGLTLELSGVSIDDRLDLADNDLLIKDASIGQVEPLLRSARNADPLWQGPGIATGAAGPYTGLAALQQGADVLVKLTYNGDANGDGRINADDYFRIDSGFLAQPANPSYRDGDFNYDDTINADDYFLIDSAFLGQGGPLATGTELEGARATVATARPPFGEPRRQVVRKRPVRPVFSERLVSVLD